MSLAAVELLNPDSGIDLCQLHCFAEERPRRCAVGIE